LLCIGYFQPITRVELGQVLGKDRLLAGNIPITVRDLEDDPSPADLGDDA
jgi:hypothetical protein